MKKPVSIDIRTVLDGVQNRREFLKLFGKGLGYSALASSLSACGGGGGGDGGGTDPVQPAATPLIPQASSEYTVLKRVTFGLHRDERNAIENIGIDAWLERQLDYSQIDDGDLEATIQSLFPLTVQSPDQIGAQKADGAGYSDSHRSSPPVGARLWLREITAGRTTIVPIQAAVRVKATSKPK